MKLQIWQQGVLTASPNEFQNDQLPFSMLSRLLYSPVHHYCLHPSGDAEALAGFLQGQSLKALGGQEMSKYGGSVKGSEKGIQPRCTPVSQKHDDREGVQLHSSRSPAVPSPSTASASCKATFAESLPRWSLPKTSLNHIK